MSIPPPRPVFDPTTVRVVREFRHARPLIGCRFDPYGRFLFVSAEDDSIQRFDLLTGGKTTFTGHRSWVRGMAVVPPKRPTTPASDSTRPWLATGAVIGFAGIAVPPPAPEPFTLVTADYHGNLIWWQGESGEPKPLHTVKAHDGFARAVTISPDGSTVASCGNDRTIRLWKTADGSAIRTLEGHESHVYNIAFHPDGARLVSCDLKGVVKDWNVTTGKCERTIDAKVLTKYDPTFMADIGGARGIAFRPDGTAFALCGITNVSNAFAGIGNPAVVLVGWADGRAKLLKTKEAFQGTAWGVGFHRSGAVIAAGGGGQGRVWIWTGDDPVNVHTLTVPTNARDFALTPTADGFAVATANGTAFLYDFAGTPPIKRDPPPKS
jgi:WD40 repeat protein